MAKTKKKIQSKQHNKKEEIIQEPTQAQDPIANIMIGLLQKGINDKFDSLLKKLDNMQEELSIMKKNMRDKLNELDN